MMKRLTAFAAAGAAMMAMSSTAQAQHLFSTWLEPNHVITRYAHIEWAERLSEATNGEIDFEIFMGASLIPAVSTMQGIADGLAQGGFHTGTYTPSDLPINNALADMGFIVPDPFVMAFASADFMMNEAIGYNEWRENGVIYAGGYSVPEYFFLCRRPMRTLEDFRGARVRMPGGGWARFGEAIGTVNVNIPSNEIYTAFDRGSVDCTASDASHLTGGSTIMEVTRGVTTLSMSPFYAGVTWALNPDFWAGLSAEQRRIVLDESARSMARLQIAYSLEANEALELARERGIEIIEPDATLQEAYDQWVADGVGDMVGIARERHGIEDPEALFASFQKYIDKWVAILGEIDVYDEDALIAVSREHLYDLIDENSFGLN